MQKNRLLLTLKIIALYYIFPILSYSFHFDMSNSASYATIIQRLYRINAAFPVKMDLSNSRALYQILGNPLDKSPVVHVGGTNGKGSVSLKIASILRHSGLKVGLFVSPHISSFRERIQVNGELLLNEDVHVSCNLLYSYFPYVSKILKHMLILLLDASSRADGYLRHPAYSCNILRTHYSSSIQEVPARSVRCRGA